MREGVLGTEDIRGPLARVRLDASGTGAGERTGEGGWMTAAFVNVFARTYSTIAPKPSAARSHLSAPVVPGPVKWI